MHVHIPLIILCNIVPIHPSLSLDVLIFFGLLFFILSLFLSSVQFELIDQMAFAALVATRERLLRCANAADFRRVLCERHGSAAAVRYAAAYGDTCIQYVL